MGDDRVGLGLACQGAPVNQGAADKGGQQQQARQQDPLQPVEQDGLAGDECRRGQSVLVDSLIRDIVLSVMAWQIDGRDPLAGVERSDLPDGFGMDGLLIERLVNSVSGTSRQGLELIVVMVFAQQGVFNVRG